MAKVQIHIAAGDTPEYRRTFYYGKLENSPYEDRWFVNFGTRTYTNESPDYTFVLREASPVYLIEHLGNDPEKWQEHSLHCWTGAWCAGYETLWKDIPYWTHEFTEGGIARYGMSCTPHPDHDDEYLWYVTIAPGVESEDFSAFGAHTFIVDKACTEPNYMNQMGSDPDRWAQVSWEHPTDDRDPRTNPWHTPNRPDIYWIFHQDEKNRRWWKKILR